MKLFRLLIPIALAGLMAAPVRARLGESEDRLIDRYGHPVSRSNHFVIIEDQRHVLGPTLFFKQAGWNIKCDLIDDRCVRITYSKPGAWSEEQIQKILHDNAQEVTWTETSRPHLAKLQRTWQRLDGSTASWQKGINMSLVWDLYNEAKAALERSHQDIARM